MIVQDVKIIDSDAGLTFIGKSHALTNPERHFHSFWEIFYIVDGERTFFHANGTYAIGPGDLLCVRPGVLHRSINLPGKTCSLYNVYFADIVTAEVRPFINDIIPLLERFTAKFGPVLHLSEIDRFTAERFFSDAARELTMKQDGYITMVRSLVCKFLVEMSRYTVFDGSKSKQPAKPSAVSARISQVIAYLSENFRSPVTLRSAASYFAVSETYLSRSFRRETHFSFIEYLNGLRITESCRLLTETDMSVTDIAYECGFGSITQFGRCFTSFTGETPLVYRRRSSFTLKKV